MNLCVQIHWAGFFGAFLHPERSTPWTQTMDTMNESGAEDRDALLLQKAADGDADAFAAFYDRHSVLMYSVAMRILGDPSEAKDVLQESCIQIWEKASKFDPKLGKASSWAAILVRNRAVDRIRSLQRRQRLSEEAAMESSLEPAPGKSANDVLYKQEKAALIGSAIMELPQDQRQAIDLAYFKGLTHHQIAEKLQEPLGTIKARIRRGLLRMRDKLEGLS